MDLEVIDFVVKHAFERYCILTRVSMSSFMIGIPIILTNFFYCGRLYYTLMRFVSIV